MESTINNFQKILTKKNLSGFIVTNQINILYLSGFRGISQTEREAILVVTPKKATLITARLYQTEALRLKSKLLNINIASERNEYDLFTKTAITKSGSANSTAKTPLKIGFEEHNMTIGEYKHFKKLFRGSKLMPFKHVIEDLRIIKSAYEINNIGKAQKISQKAFNQVVKTIKIGQTEAEIAQNLEKLIKSLGGQGLAFDTIVASGPNSALPHYVTGRRKIKKGDVLLFDFGAKYKNFCADLSRTIFVGKAGSREANIYNHVFAAQKKALSAIKPKILSSSVHKTALSYFKTQSLDEFFIHSLGHGIGLEVHEKPSLGIKSKDKLAENMVFSVEPGLYFPQWGGVRIEDLVTIKNGKAQILGGHAELIEI